MTSSLISGCVVGGGASGDSSGSSGESSLIDEKLDVSIRCYLAPYADNFFSDETGMVIPAGAYVEFIKDVTVTNYSQKSADIYVEYLAYDNNGKAMNSGNWYEIVTAGQTLNFPENSGFQANSEFVINPDGSFNCEVTQATL